MIAETTVDLARTLDFTDKFLGWMRGRGAVLIVTHDHPDPDSLAAAMALKHLITVKTGQPATVAFGGMIGRGENRVMVRKLEIDLVPLNTLDLDRFPVVCMVDSQPGTGNNSYPFDRRVDLVIDHHPLRESCRNVRWVDVREEYGATATMLFEYLEAQKVSYGTKLATILYYAIKSETQDLGRDWIRADRRAYLHLLPLVNNSILFDILHAEVPRAYFAHFSHAIRNAMIYNEVLVFNLFEIDTPDMVAELADFLLRVDEVKIVLGMGHYKDGVALSFRTLRNDLNSGEIMQTLVAGFGTGGGHDMIAGGQIPDTPADRDTLVRLEQTLTQRLLQTLGCYPVPGLPLVAE
ncbi:MULTISPECIES: DHH family phosphoesterase [Syntrophotalea]|uniref:Phosphoesterase n=1 Tax=Syntrophotalea acetylenica TaxID=29542 RepID=A0A1L3GCF4_SYNAC|nr:DHH family phosphoesterase [Syntrophotalea acetylenica]APG23631.1 phosphoesterase [Syntrophotalea acetylenica]APG44209.1 phosphoesterase [Syntrophotalea acetylenica]